MMTVLDCLMEEDKKRSKAFHDALNMADRSPYGILKVSKEKYRVIEKVMNFRHSFGGVGVNEYIFLGDPMRYYDAMSRYADLVREWIGLQPDRKTEELELFGGYVVFAGTDICGFCGENMDGPPGDGCGQSDKHRGAKDNSR